MEGLNMTQECGIRKRWGLAYNLVVKVNKKTQKKVLKVAKCGTLCVFLLQQKVNGKYWMYKVLIGGEKFDGKPAV